VEIFVKAGANVVFADMNVTGGQSVEQKVEGYLSVRFVELIAEKSDVCGDGYFFVAFGS